MGVRGMKRSIKLKAGIFFLDISLMCSAVHYILLHPAKVSYTPPQTVITRDNVDQMRFVASWEFYSYVTFSRDGKWLAIVERETIRLIDTESGQQRHFLRHLQCFSLLSFFTLPQCDDLEAFSINTENGIAISTAGNVEVGTGSMKLWDIEDGRQIATLENTNFIFAMSLNYNGTQVAYQTRGSLHVTDLNTQRHVTNFPVSGYVWTFSYSPTEPCMAYTSGGVYLQNTESEDDPIKLSDRNFQVLEFTQDGSTLVGWNYSGEDNFVELWHLDTHETVEMPLGDDAESWSVNFSPDRRLLAVSDVGETYDVWVFDTDTGVKRLTLAHDTIQFTSFSHDGRMLAAVSRGDFVRIWDTENGSQLYERNFPTVLDAAFSPKGDLFVVRTQDSIKLFGIDE